MSKFSAKNFSRAVIAGILIFLGIATYGGAMYLHDKTIVTWWIPAAISFLLAGISGLTMWRLWRRLTDSKSFVFNYICHLALSCGIFLFAIYFFNYTYAKESTTHTENVLVDKKFTKIRHHRQRVSRRSYRQGNPYKVYYFDLKFENGKEKTVSVSSSRYNRIQRLLNPIDYQNRTLRIAGGIWCVVFGFRFWVFRDNDRCFSVFRDWDIRVPFLGFRFGKRVYV